MVHLDTCDYGTMTPVEPPVDRNQAYVPVADLDKSTTGTVAVVAPP